jgi:hypothetical protein
MLVMPTDPTVSRLYGTVISTGTVWLPLMKYPAPRSIGLPLPGDTGFPNITPWNGVGTCAPLIVRLKEPVKFPVADEKVITNPELTG